MEEYRNNITLGARKACPEDGNGKSLERAFQAGLSALFPRHCPVCHDIVQPRGALICPECEKRLHFVEAPTCLICGREIQDETEELCSNCKRHHFSFERGISLLQYDQVTADSMAKIKYLGAREYLEYYGKKAAERLGEDIYRMKPDALVPVPVHVSRRRIRGYNQAGVLAEILGKELDIPVYEDAIRRNKRTAALKSLGAGERLKSLSAAFERGVIPKDLKTVLLVDDIFTTGATMEACTRILRHAGVKTVYCLSLCIRSER